jgi:hypothetical protein
VVEKIYASSLITFGKKTLGQNQLIGENVAIPATERLAYEFLNG